MKMKSCNRATLGKKMRAARVLPIAPILRPLRNHMLRLAAHSARQGYCQRAGIEVRQARLLAEKYPTTDAYDAAVARAKGQLHGRNGRR